MILRLFAVQAATFIVSLGTHLSEFSTVFKVRVKRSNVSVHSWDGIVSNVWKTDSWYIRDLDGLPKRLVFRLDFPRDFLNRSTYLSVQVEDGKWYKVVSPPNNLLKEVPVLGNQKNVTGEIPCKGITVNYTSETRSLEHTTDDDSEDLELQKLNALKDELRSVKKFDWHSKILRTNWQRHFETTVRNYIMMDRVLPKDLDDRIYKKWYAGNQKPVIHGNVRNMVYNIWMRPESDANIKVQKKMPTIKPDLFIADKRLFKDGDFWFVRNKDGVPVRIVHQGEKMIDNPSMIYARAEDERWYRFEKPQNEFKEYVNQLPVLEKPNDTDRLFNDGTEWLVLSKCTDEFVKFTYKGDNRGFDTSLVYVRAADRMWYTFVKPPRDFILWLADLPKVGEVSEFTHWHNKRLVLLEGGNIWHVKSNNGCLRKILYQEPTSHLQSGIEIRVQCDDKKWYRFRKPPSKFIEFLSSIPEKSGIAGDSDSLNRSDGGLSRFKRPDSRTSVLIVDPDNLEPS